MPRRRIKTLRIDIEDESFSYCRSCGQFYNSELEVEVAYTMIETVCRYCYIQDSYKNRIKGKGSRVVKTMDVYHELRADFPPDKKEGVELYIDKPTRPYQEYLKEIRERINKQKQEKLKNETRTINKRIRKRIRR